MKTQGDSEEVELEQESMTGYVTESDNGPGLEAELRPLVEGFIGHLKGLGRAESTLLNHRVNLKYWQRYLTEKGVRNAAEVSPAIAAGFQAWVYNFRTRFGKPFALTSQIQVLNSAQVFCRYLEESGKTLSNPAKAIRLPKAPRRLPAAILTPQEMKRLLAQPAPRTVLGFRDRTLYELLYATGMRIGEVIRLKAPDIDTRERTVTVRAGKGGKDRVLPLGATAGRYLEEYLRRVRPLLARGRGLRKARRRRADPETVFLNQRGLAFDETGLTRKLQMYALQAGIKRRVTVHTFRHTLATEMLRHGADLRQIQEMLGHASLGTTQLYTHVVKGELKRVQAQCHPRDRAPLPAGFVRYRGRTYVSAEDLATDRRAPKLYPRAAGRRAG